MSWQKSPFLCRNNKTLVKYYFIGTKNFHQGTQWGVLGNLGELFVNKENLDMYAIR
ncbi:hypothetical protein GCM10007852_20480 [Agaribacter marinus]|uniref:Uncharacterized protein n=1 Tax=Agaribacter marinus TaxID=1431249 RepID=A0AA37T442_9ALTE|nr:hypothetical protein GCM10007852_20480 [Agaribacter marinus]